ncbi:MAG TPA: sigma 54-interacting transcriptional regulator [Thermoanaerobaculia bacterium]|nr:sigma 54-interacting transcriptional regulator [Thermoanaerobaculia bacterium]
MPPSEDREPWLDTATRASGEAWRPTGPLLIPGLTLLYHPDLRRIGERAPLANLASGRAELLSRRDPDFAAPGPPGRRPLGDPHVSRTPLHLRPGPEPGSIRLVRGDCSMAVAADGEPVGAERLFSAAEIGRGVVLLLAQHVVLLLSTMDPTLPPGGLPRYGLVGESPGIVQLRQEIRRLAGLTVPVLLLGETGTGKELVARALHDVGPRAARPYLAVNLGAVPATLAASELFGAVRGAYTGADRPRDGWFTRAHTGTLFLDEIGEAPPEVQVLLLRALETGEIQPVGGGEPRRVDVRLIAATDADLETSVAEGRFRAPLLHRLGSFRLRLAPLRDRREDFGRLFLHFLIQELSAVGELRRIEQSSTESRPWIPAPLVARLAALDWPGNVRQLRNVVRQLVVAGRDGGEEALWIQAEAALQETTPRIPDSRGTLPLPGVPIAPPPPARRYRRAEDVTDDELVAALRANRWRIQSAAAQLGISRGSLYDRIDKSSKIRKAADLGREDIEACFQRCGGDLDAMVEELEVSKRGLQRRMTQLRLS